MSYVDLFSDDSTQEQGTSLEGKTLTRRDLEKNYPNTGSNSSWQYDDLNAGIASTQQIDIDWSNFANHTFFHSAEVKVNAAYERMVNHFPYDGTLEEIQSFIGSLTGYEKYILDQFPKYVGFLNFNKSIFISIKDSEGYLFPSIAKRNTLRSVLGTDATKAGYTIECFVKPPTAVNTSNQIIFQKLSADSNTGITLALSKSNSSDTTIEVHSLLSSGSGDNVYVLHASASIPRGEFTHVSTVFDKDISNTLTILTNGVEADRSNSALEIETLNFIQSDILIGSGSNHYTGSTAPETSRFLAEEPLSCSLDEFRFWTYPRKHNAISSSVQYSVENNSGLGLYLKFNEPTGSYASNNLVLDSSGNGLHGYITNYDNVNRIVDADIVMPVKYENAEMHPVLFPDYPTLAAKNVALLVTASNYDIINPNYILKLVPAHYIEGDLVQPADPTILPEYTSSLSVPGGGQLPSNQIIANFLFMWSAFFDDLKLHIDTVSDVISQNYRDIDGIPQQAISHVAKQYGYTLPNIFSDSTPEQFHLGRNLNDDILYGERSLKSILYSIWRRVTTEIPHINRTKGTISSIKMMLNAFGLDADSNFRIREYGSNPIKTISNIRKERKKPVYCLDFNTGSAMHLSSSNLLAYRWEPGNPVFADVPRPRYNTTTQVWNEKPKLIALTAGSWSYEAAYKLKTVNEYVTQSLLRMDIIGADGNKAPFLNVLAMSGSSYYPDSYKLQLQMSVSGSDDMLTGDSALPQYAVDIELPRVNMYDGDRWHIAVTSEMDPSESKALLSLTATQANGSRVYTTRTTSSYYTIDDHHPLKAYRVTDGGAIADNPAPIPVISIGSFNTYANRYIGTGSITDINAEVNSIRFWSKALSSNEITDHALNPFSIGSDDPIINSPFLRLDDPALGVTGSHMHPLVDSHGNIAVNSGSWERLRVIGDLLSNNTSSDSSGNATITDLSRNGYTFGISNAAASSAIVKPVFVNYSTLETNWDSPNITNKIRIRSFQDKQKADATGAKHGKLTELDPREIVSDDKRFSIEASVAQAINEDIANVISDLFFLNDSIGAPEMLFAVNYPDLDNLADKYFNRLVDKVDFKNYFEFFKWFDRNFTQMVEMLIPTTTEFLGVNFVIESHVLERHKLQYKQADVHIDLSRRLAARIQTIASTNVIRIT